MKKIFTVVIAFFSLINTGRSQYLNACCNDTICPGDTTFLTVSEDTFATGTVLSMIDDVYSSVIDLGFSFIFFNNTYTQCVISSNGYISFNLSYANQISAWMITQSIPAPTNPLNAIMGPWHDTDPAIDPFGECRYATVGTAPFRKFVCTFCQVPLYNSPLGEGCSDSLFTGQIVLFETSRVIEVHLTKEIACDTWNNGAAIEGIHDSLGTTAVVVPGRNYPDLWSAANDGYRFAPDDNGSYIVYPIPFNPIPVKVDSIVWTDGSGAFLGSDSSVTVMPEETTDYIATGVSSCGLFADTITITVEPCFGVGISSPHSANEIPEDASVLVVNELGITMVAGTYLQLNDLLKEVTDGFYILVVRKNDQILERRKIYLLK
ncbi:MAG TPA: hypothetical protein VE978_20730 [Chitinophagales bacterium]|nr:hypothetical protein [Chitinophagales bacterium]